jgi:hypothetical protein
MMTTLTTVDLLGHSGFVDSHPTNQGRQLSMLVWLLCSGAGRDNALGVLLPAPIAPKLGGWTPITTRCGFYGLSTLQAQGLDDAQIGCRTTGLQATWLMNQSKPLCVKPS